GPDRAASPPPRSRRRAAPGWARTTTRRPDLENLFDLLQRPDEADALLGHDDRAFDQDRRRRHRVEDRRVGRALGDQLLRPGLLHAQPFARPEPGPPVEPGELVARRPSL